MNNRNLKQDSGLQRILWAVCIAALTCCWAPALYAQGQTTTRSAKVDRVTIGQVKRNPNHILGVGYGSGQAMIALSSLRSGIVNTGGGSVKSEKGTSTSNMADDDVFVVNVSLAMSFKAVDTIDYTFTVPRPGFYSFDFVSLNELGASTEVYLWDKQEDIMIRILPGMTFGFYAAQTGLNTRFAFVLKNPSAPTSVKAQVAQGGYRAYPNPAASVVTFDNGLASATYTVIVFDITGQTVMRSASNSARLDISVLNQGVYFAKVNGSKAIRFVKE